MLHDFLATHRGELIDRCRRKAASRRPPDASAADLTHGIPLFIDQLRGMLPAAHPPPGTSPPAPPPLAEREIREGAARHGSELMRHQFSIGQVVHDYGDLCQAIMELALEKDYPITVQEFATLNIRLDDAIAGAVSEYARQSQARRLHERVAGLAAEMRNLLNTTVVAISAIRSGGVGFAGATATALDRSLIGMRVILDRVLAEAHDDGGSESPVETVEVAAFLAAITLGAEHEAALMGCELIVAPVEDSIFMEADPRLLASALSILLQAAFRSSGREGVVVLGARSSQRRVLIEVQDGNNSADPAERRAHGSSFDLIREGIQAGGGQLFTREAEGGGCIATIALPRKSMLALD